MITAISQRDTAAIITSEVCRITYVVCWRKKNLLYNNNNKVNIEFNDKFTIIRKLHNQNIVKANKMLHATSC